jgi:hypothetical protein
MASNRREALIQIFLMVKLYDFLLCVTDAHYLGIRGASEVELSRFASHFLVSLVFQTIFYLKVGCILVGYAILY